MEKIEKLIDKLEDNIRWWKRAIETDGFESDEEGSYRRDLENTKKELFNLISQELDKAREEGYQKGLEDSYEDYDGRLNDPGVREKLGLSKLNKEE